jgi:hypothetical protein
LSLVVQAWLIVATVLALAEAVVAAVLCALHVSSGWQWLAFLGISSVLLVVVQRRRRAKG